MTGALAGGRAAWTCGSGRRFETQAGQWQEIRLPFAELALSVMGRTVPGVPRIAGDQIRSLSFLIADGDETPFALEIDWIGAYRESASVAAGGRCLETRQRLGQPPING